MKKKENLNAGDEIQKDRGGWDFNSGVAKTFDVHVKKSVPFYEEGHQIILDSSDYFIKNNSNVIDIGCSKGKLIQKLYNHHKHKEGVNYLGIDSSKEMIQYANDINLPNTNFISRDITKAKIKKNSITILYYTLQFIDTAYRQDVIDKVYDSLEWGGALFLFEKVRAPDARFQDIMSSTYEELKIRNNFSDEEIMSKKRSLIGVLEPFSTQGNIDILKRAGFQDIASIFKYICFEGFLAIK